MQNIKINIGFTWFLAANNYKLNKMRLHYTKKKKNNVPLFKNMIYRANLCQLLF